ncbi:MAG: hypothetical protein FVQ83_15865 [Chloroflexi bacterium]|nr:hypothetical protein [Chloroflexota bacterium]
MAFTSDRNGNRGIYVINVDGGSATRLTDNPAGVWNSTWQP